MFKVEEAPKAKKGKGAKNNNPAPSGGGLSAGAKLLLGVIALLLVVGYLLLPKGDPLEKLSREELSRRPLTAETRRVYSEVLQGALRERKLARASSEDEEPPSAFWGNLVALLNKEGKTEQAGYVATIAYLCRLQNCPMVEFWISALQEKKPSPILIEWVVEEVRATCCPPDPAPELEEGGPGGDNRPTVGGKRPGGGKGGRMKPPRPKLGGDGQPQ